jgi:hypothetical protein
MPPLPLRGPSLIRSRACAERAYKNWKRFMDKLWEDECHHQQAEARQCLLDERTANKCQEAACRQRLLDKEANHHQRHLVACAAQARRTVAATTILLWLCHHRLKICLAWRTARQQQRKAALARMQYEQECCTRTVLAEKKATTGGSRVGESIDQRGQQAMLPQVG